MILVTIRVMEEGKEVFVEHPLLEKKT